MSTEILAVPDGLEELKHEMPSIVRLIVRTARWVHPDSFRALPVWYPETARRQSVYDSRWQRVYKNKNRITGAVAEKFEPNIRAKKAFLAALGARPTKNWTVCHIWGVDDPRFQSNNRVVCDPKFYSCVANMVWLPSPLKGFTDVVPEIKSMLRTCSFYLYDWICEHDDVKVQAAAIRSGQLPEGYPEAWPAPGRIFPPPGTANFTARIVSAIERRKGELRRMLADRSLTKFPREQVEGVLKFWNIRL
ncbi:MAG: hypothetical protein HY233_01065 [Acidobacteriales bacterium]|nr:hypothetical protein [Terriglobales bacterium]